MKMTRRRLLILGVVGLLVAAVAVSWVRGTHVTDDPFQPASSDEGVRCEVVAWPGQPDGPTGVRCAAVFDRPIEALWGPLTDYARLPGAFDSALYDFEVDQLEGAAPGPVTLKGAVRFWLMRFPLDLTLQHSIDGATRTVRWESDVPRFVTRGSWRLEALAPDRTRVEYLLDARVSLLPDFVVKVVLRDNLPRVLRALQASSG